MKKILLGALAALIFFAGAHAQTQATLETQYRMPLKAVLDSIQSRFGVKLSYPADLVEGREVTYAMFRFEYDFQATLDHILDNQDLSAAYRPADGSYRITPYHLNRRTPEVGKERLDYLAGLYGNRAEWEARRRELRGCIYENMNVAPLRDKMTLRPAALTPVRRMNGYSVQNFALETLPGLYITGSIYVPADFARGMLLTPVKSAKKKYPLVLNPNGHYDDGRYDPDIQARSAAFARMGAVSVNFDLYAFGEQRLQFDPADHRTRSVGMTVQMLNVLALLDYFLAAPYIDPGRVGITGCSGGGGQSSLFAALDERIKVAAPVVNVSSYNVGLCACEAGLPIHLCGRGTNQAEITAMIAPRPVMIVSCGADQTALVPELEFPYIQRIYGFYDRRENVENAHFGDEPHDYGFSKRKAVYEFMARRLGLDLDAMRGAGGEIDEAVLTIEPEQALYAFGPKGEGLPANAIRGTDNLNALIRRLTAK